MEDRHPLIDEFVRLLSLDGDARWDGTAVVVTRLRDTPLEEPVIITVDERSLAAVIDIPAETRDALWPGDDLRVAGFRLLLVHVEELIATDRFPMRITESGIEAPESTLFEDAPLDPSDGPFELRSPLTGSTFTPGREGRRRRRRARRRP